MDSVCVCRFLHISDVHFGIPDPKTGDARTPPAWAYFKRFDGLLGHSYQALMQLEELLRDLRSEVDQPEPRLIVTGDLTTCGRPEEFQLGREFLGDLARLRDTLVGLRRPDWQQLSIPGNHDRWRGRPHIFGGPTDAFATMFGDLPLVPALDLGRGQSLRFLRLDSDADVRPWGVNRFFARGSFTSELERLANALPPPDPHGNEVRVLLMHHSPAIKGWTMGMEPASRRALDVFLQEHDVAVILTGHAHEPALHLHVVSRRGIESKAIEARCGTSTQQDALPFAVKKLWGGRRDDPTQQHMAFVHRVLRYPDKSLHWDVQSYGRRRRRFVRGPVHPHPKPLETTFQIWPAIT